MATSVSSFVGSAFESGKAFMTAVGDGMKSALASVRNLLPFSDAKEAPLAGLT